MFRPRPKQPRSKSNAKGRKKNINKVRGPPRCYYKVYPKLKSCRSTAYKQYGSSSDSRWDNPCQDNGAYLLNKRNELSSPKTISTGCTDPNKDESPITTIAPSSEYLPTDVEEDGSTDDSPCSDEEGDGKDGVNNENGNQTKLSLDEIIRRRRTELMERVVQTAGTNCLAHLVSGGFLYHDYSNHARTTTHLNNLANGNKKGLHSLYLRLGINVDRAMIHNARMQAVRISGKIAPKPWTK